MTSSKPMSHPSMAHRIFSVWYRHMRVYTKNILSNGLPPFVEPLIFLSAIGMGLGRYVVSMDNIPYIQFLASGLLVTTAMFTAAFECTYGTFVRLEYDKTYDYMLAAPVTVNNLLIGEILWAGTKGMFFSTAVLTVMTLFGILSPILYLVAPFVGFLTGTMFACIALLITSVVTDLNQFNFFFTGFISPMFFFSGVVFSLDNLPRFLRVIAEFLPLTHSVRLIRACCLEDLGVRILFDVGYILLFILLIGRFAIHRLTKKLID